MAARTIFDQELEEDGTPRAPKEPRTPGQPGQPMSPPGGTSDAPGDGEMYPAEVEHVATVRVRTDLDTGEHISECLAVHVEPEVTRRRAQAANSKSIEGRHMDIDVGEDGVLLVRKRRLKGPHKVVDTRLAESITAIGSNRPGPPRRGPRKTLPKAPAGRRRRLAPKPVFPKVGSVGAKTAPLWFDPPKLPGQRR